MKVGFIGAGTVTGTSGRHLINADHTIVVSNSKGPRRSAHLLRTRSSRQYGYKAAGSRVRCVILATQWVNVRDALKGIDWRSRILIDATNAHMDPVPDISLAGVTRSRAALKGRTSSEMAAGARLVKSISDMPMDWIQDFSAYKPRTVVFTSGADTEAKWLVIDLINSTGMVAIDLGSVAVGGAMHEVGAPLSGLDPHFIRWHSLGTVRK